MTVQLELGPEILLYRNSTQCSLSYNSGFSPGF
jgi:hypothetical protein